VGQLEPARNGKWWLFLAVLILFTAVGFFVKFLLIRLGWVGGLGVAEPPPVSAAPPPADTETAPPSLNPQELEQAKQTTERFLRAYVNGGDPSQRLAELRQTTTSVFYSLLERETRDARPTGSETRLVGVERTGCERRGAIVSCLAETLIEEKENGQSVRMERVYRISLVSGGSEWQVEEVEAIGNFD
jgi:hypothetical protein